MRLVSLAEARQRALANRKLAREGGVPLKKLRRPTAGVPTFEEAAAKVLELHRGAWRKGSKTAQHWQATMRDYALPSLGPRPVDKVTSADILETLQPIWTTKHVTARKVLYRIGTVMRWAIAQGYRTDNPAGDAVTAALPRRPAPVKHRKALSHTEVAEAILTVRNSRAWVGTRLAFEFLVLTAARSAEVRLATWTEIDLVAGVWRVPDTRMKAKREHRVSLSGRAVEVLREAEELRPGSPQDHEWVFVTRRGLRIDASKMGKVIRDLGIDAVPHGFRSSFRDWASERTDHPRGVVEAALAHVVKDQTEAAYARSDLFERRRHLMEDWAEYLAEARGQVVSLRG